MTMPDIRMLEAWVGRARTRAGEDALDRGPVPLPAHVGLWLDRCLYEPEGRRQNGSAGEKRGRRALYDAAMGALQGTDTPAVANYRHIYERWRGLAEQREPGVARWQKMVRTRSRLHLHPATGSTVTEGGILLHHTYGVPYIPGSALKGVARRRAEQAFGRDDPRVTALFGLERGRQVSQADVGEDGDADEAGFLQFWDALWVPDGKPAEGPLALDVVNPHHSGYYTSTKKRPYPLETDEPVPTHLLTVAPGTAFLLVLEAPEMEAVGREWLEWVAEQALLSALRDEGIGARTTAGYGRLVPDGEKWGAKGESAGRSAGPAAPVGPARGAATVSLEKGGGGVLRARLPDGKTAEARGAAVATLLEGLPEAVQERLKKGKEAKLVAAWEPEGNARRLVGLTET